MKKIKDSIKYVKITDLLSPFLLLLTIIPALIFKIYNRIIKRNLWLICEEGNVAKDNGYHFFKYVRINHPNDYCFFVINKKSNDYKKVKQYGNIIQFKSIKHWIYYLAADYNISTQKMGNPNQVLFYIIHVSLGLMKNRVFLQHGITKDDSPWLYYKNTKFKYFICGAKKEYEYIKEKFGYPNGNVIYTGFPRFDNLYNNSINKKQVLIMPTWRNWLGRETNALGEKIDFTKTDFYKNWNNLLNNKKFINYIEKNNIKVIFYPHQHMQKYLENFKTKSKSIYIVNMTVDIQDVLKSSEILITDYSSVYMDFAYMLKPVIYFQFDYEEYREKQLQQGYFDYEKNGFGPIASSVDETVDELIKYFDNKMSKKYLKREKDFFELHDQHNCQRIYETLKGK